MSQDDVLTKFICRSRLSPEEIVALLKDIVKKREIQQFNQTFGEMPTDQLIHFATCLDKVINPVKKTKKKAKKKKATKVNHNRDLTKDKGRGIVNDAKSNPS